MAGFFANGNCYPCPRTNLLPISPTAQVEFSEADSVPWHNLSGASRPAVTPNEVRNPKLTGRMPFRAR
jgi:hypothetical protein